MGFLPSSPNLNMPLGSAILLKSRRRQGTLAEVARSSARLRLSSSLRDSSRASSILSNSLVYGPPKEITSFFGDSLLCSICANPGGRKSLKVTVAGAGLALPLAFWIIHGSLSTNGSSILGSSWVLQLTAAPARENPKMSQWHWRNYYYP